MEREQARQKERKELREINLNKLPTMGMGNGGMGTKSLPRRSDSGREHNQLICWDRIHGTSTTFPLFFFLNTLKPGHSPFFSPSLPCHRYFTAFFPRKSSITCLSVIPFAHQPFPSSPCTPRLISLRGRETKKYQIYRKFEARHSWKERERCPGVS